jgi:hypothetical protein
VSAKGAIDNMSELVLYWIPLSAVFLLIALLIGSTGNDHGLGEKNIVTAQVP